MSTILDALRKAESERHSGGMPALDAPVARFLEPPPSYLKQRWWMIALPCLLLAGAAGGWFAALPEKTTEKEEIAPPVVVAQTAQTDAPAIPTPFHAPSGEVIPEESAPIAVQPPDAAPPSVSHPTPHKAVERKTAPSIQKKQHPETTEAMEAKPKAAPATPSATTAPVTPAPAPLKKIEQAKTPPEPLVPTLYELPPDIQREIPTFSLSGYMYSDNPAASSVLLGRRLLHAGDRIMPGLVLERMTPEGMVLNYNGHRYRMPYQ